MTELPQLMSAPAAEAVIDGRRMLYFGGTGYLGLQAHPAVIGAARQALEQYGIHSATTRTNFASPPVREVERLSAELLGQEEAFYFGTGYLGARIVLEGVRGEFDVLFVDAEAHFSVREAAAQSGLACHRFRHRDPLDLRDKLAAHLPARARPLLLCDGVSPVTGAIAPLAEYCAELERYPGAGVLVDDAHAFGVLGAQGHGTWEHFGWSATAVNSEAAAGAVRPLACVTLSKAIGGHGGLIAGSAGFVHRLKEQSGCYRGATPPAAPVAAASAAGLRLALQEPTLRQRLRANIALLHSGLDKLSPGNNPSGERGTKVLRDPTPIAALTIGDGANMLRIQRELLRRDIAIGYLRSYTNLGPHGALRIAVFADHQPWMIERLFAELTGLVAGH